MLLYLKINCVNIRAKVPTISKQDDFPNISNFPKVLFQTFLHVILLKFTIYFCVIIMVKFWFADTRGLCWGITIQEFLVNLLAMIRSRIRLLASLKKVNCYSSNSKKNKYEIGGFWYCYYGIQNPRTFKLCIKVSPAEFF